MLEAVRKSLNDLLQQVDADELHLGLKGLEKESLRVTADGSIAQTPHPAVFGSALTHPWITTDYSEALLEFITPPASELQHGLQSLDEIHRHVLSHLDEELLWTSSMPCVVRGADNIPIARYGDSNIGRMRHIYRRGLDWRYGRAMQAIAGIHFNYSFSGPVLRALQAQRGHRGPIRDFSSKAYFGLIRNFQRFGWLIPLLYGASPALCRSFAGNQELGFSEFSDDTLYEPYGTSLRMSDIGYKNKAQAALNISYDSLESYVASLSRAINTSDAEYERIGVRVEGEYRQLNTNVLQIENEYYSFIRPKAVARSGEKPTLALQRAGVEYIEVRALDLNPFEAIGTNVETLRFVECLLYLCLLRDSPPISPRELGGINRNQGLVARYGRDPDLVLQHQRDAQLPLRDWALSLLDEMALVAAALDRGRTGSPYAEAIDNARLAVEDTSRTLSAQVLAQMQQREEGFIEFALAQSRLHARQLKARPLSGEQEAIFTATAAQSLSEQHAIEAADELSFEDYLARYMEQDAISAPESVP
ncbi:glutamate--cysteine ligase [Methylonatrum kenyense]|uniref:glutamate--cysteine ligase n=1 Tax=Methylonatrum kenyense TaxID=455253 RepID=UPI0020BFF456|nr:glutamate--cysteine ligase [Methylonatrum kenyense]MCK8517137.1 glutamate--cysteine ligase [Methylonatrum kenyense]